MMERYIEAHSRAEAVDMVLGWSGFSELVGRECAEQHIGTFATSLYIRGAIIMVMDRGALDDRPGYAVLLSSLAEG